MARKIKDINLETRAARKRLAVRAEPHWRALDQGLHLGYRHRSQGGSWTARRRNALGRYEETKLGAADDMQDANGVTFLDYWQAQGAARIWDTERGRLEQGLDPKTGLSPDDAPGDYTVGAAMRDYLAHYTRHGKALDATTSSVNAHILPPLKDVLVAKLTARRIAEWHLKLADTAARVRSKKDKETRFRKAAESADAKRGRRATANRVLTILKAALNHAWNEGKTPTDSAWRRVKPFREVSSANVRYLTDAECKRLVNGCNTKKHPGFRELVQAAMLTGCRYGELVALECADFNPDAGTLAIRMSKAGKVRYVTLTEEAARFFAQRTVGQPRNQRLLRREEGNVWGKAHQHRPLAEACKRAKISPAINFHMLRHTHGSLLAMQGVPMKVIADQLGHADTRMTEKHYAHLSPSYVAATIRAHFPDLGIVPETNVRSLGKKRRTK